MILPLLSVGFQQAITVVSLPDATAQNVTCQALIRLPKLSDQERLCIKVAWPSILDGSEEYSSFTLRRYLQQAGKPVAAYVLSDHLLLRLTFPKNQFNTAVSMLESLLRRPVFENEVLERELASLRHPKKNVWLAALEPEGWREAKPSRAEVIGVYRKLIRPENLFLAFGGAFEPEQVQAALRRFDDWKPKPEQGYVRPWAVTFSPLMKSPNSVGTVELSGPMFPANDPSLPVRLLEATALGVGSGSTLSRVSRELNGWSYTQEGFLYPTYDGLRLRLLLTHAGTLDLLPIIDGLRSGLIDQVKGWTQADRSRALTLLKSWLIDGMGYSPIWLLPEGKLVHSEDERTHLAAWWRMKFGADLNPLELIEKVEKVTLDELKERALDDIEKASARMLVPTR